MSEYISDREGKNKKKRDSDDEMDFFDMKFHKLHI